MSNKRKDAWKPADTFSKKPTEVDLDDFRRQVQQSWSSPEFRKQLTPAQRNDVVQFLKMKGKPMNDKSVRQIKDEFDAIKAAPEQKMPFRAYVFAAAAGALVVLAAVLTFQDYRRGQDDVVTDADDVEDE